VNCDGAETGKTNDKTRLCLKGQCHVRTILFNPFRLKA
jgi:hypothetical protein